MSLVVRSKDRSRWERPFSGTSLCCLGGARSWNGGGSLMGFPCWWTATAFVRCPEVKGLMPYVEHIPLWRRVWLSTKSLLKMVPPTVLIKEGKSCFCSMVEILRECVWKTHVNGLVTNIFIPDAGLLWYFKYHLKNKIALERRYFLQSLYTRH